MRIAKNNFLNLKEAHSSFEKSRVVIIPFGLEESVSYGKGTGGGPKAIIKASRQVELFDEEFQKNLSDEIGIATLKEIKIDKKVGKALRDLDKIVREVHEFSKLPIVLGGEHSLTVGAIRSAFEKYGELTILQFDAHADLRDSYDKNKHSHAAAMRRCLELSDKINLAQVGIRNISNEIEEGLEFNFWKNNQKRVKTFFAKDMGQWETAEIIGVCKENVYLTFDVDVFDSAVMPATGTPEPGGMDWYKVLDILKMVAHNKKIIGADFVELAPIKNFAAPDFTIAKLIYKFIGYVFFRGKNI